MAEKHFRELLVLYLLGEITSEEGCSLERHVQRCPDCRRELEGLRETDALLRKWASHVRWAPSRCPMGRREV